MGKYWKTNGHCTAINLLLLGISEYICIQKNEDFMSHEPDKNLSNEAFEYCVNDVQECGNVTKRKFNTVLESNYFSQE